MATARDMIAKTEDRQLAKKAPPRVLALLEAQAPQFALALPKFMDVDHFKRVVMTEVRRTPALLECEPVTVIAACMLAAQLGMEPGPLGQCYLLPRNNHKTGQKECNFQLGYKGALALAHRSGEIADITCEAVHEHDDFARELGDNARIHHVPAPWGKDRGEAIGYYAVVRTKNGGTYRAAMSREEVLAHARQFSEAFRKGDPQYGPWHKHFDEMSRKTVLLRALKLAPMAVDIARGLAQDGTTHRDVIAEMSAADQGADDVTMTDATVVDDHPIDPATGEILDK